MSVHWVNYDLNKTGQDYAKLIAYLKSHQSWAKPLKSSFFVKTTLTSMELLEGIMEHIDANDAVVVVTVTNSSWASIRISSEVNEWLQENL